MNYWLVVGAVKNWDTAFEHGNIWGLKTSQQHLWDALAEGDRAIFYATQPVGGVIGHGVVRTKFRQSNHYGLRNSLDVKSYGLYALSLI